MSKFGFSKPTIVLLLITLVFALEINAYHNKQKKLSQKQESPKLSSAQINQVFSLAAKQNSETFESCYELNVLDICFAEYQQNLQTLQLTDEEQIKQQKELNSELKNIKQNLKNLKRQIEPNDIRNAIHELNLLQTSPRKELYACMLHQVDTCEELYPNTAEQKKNTGPPRK